MSKRVEKRNEGEMGGDKTDGEKLEKGGGEEVSEAVGVGFWVGRRHQCWAAK